ncbi:MAG TPA: rod shape-determining protein MreD [Candidatus Hypogeohydataceae bacterium YC41]
MLWVILVVTALFIALLETTTFPYNLGGNLLGIRPDLFLLSTVFCALRMELLQASLVGLVMGLLKDLFSQDRIGLQTSFLTGIAIILGLLKNKLYKDHILDQLLIVFITSMLHRGICAIIIVITYQSASTASILWKVFMGSLLTLAVAPGPYLLLNKFLPPVRWKDVS